MRVHEIAKLQKFSLPSETKGPYRGVVVAIVTPCLPSGEGDPPAMRRLCRKRLDAQLQALALIR